MDGFSETMQWIWSTSGLQGAADAVSGWISGIDWTPLFVVAGVAAAAYAVYVLLDESL